HAAPEPDRAAGVRAGAAAPGPGARAGPGPGGHGGRMPAAARVRHPPDRMVAPAVRTEKAESTDRPSAPRHGGRLFQVDPNLWLQSLASPFLTWLMLGISQLGLTLFYVALIVVLGFGVRLRPTLGVMLALLMAGLATHAAKSGFELPRPVDVDARVLNRMEAPRALVDAGGAPGFLDLPTQEARDSLRATAEPDYGFVSGHTSAATAMCLSLLLFFGLRRRAAWVALAAWPLLMGFSRMYLGRHFLAAGGGGLVVGIVAALLAYWLLAPRADARNRRSRLWLLAGGVGVLCALAPFTLLLHPTGLGQLAGLVLVLVVMAWRGYPADAGTIGQRVGRVAVLCVFFVLCQGVADGIGEAAGWSEASAAWIPVVAVATTVMFLGAIAVSRSLGWYREPV